MAIPFSALAYTASSYHVLQFNAGSSRRTTVTGDWSPGNNKAECGVGETLTGVDQYWWLWSFNRCCNDGEAVEALCRTDTSQAFTHTATSCRNVSFATADNRSGFAWDWDVGATKGECAADEYVAGVSQSAPANLFVPSQIQSILCCKGGVDYAWPDHQAADGCVATTTRQSPTSSGAWDPLTGYVAQLECGDGYYMAGLSHDAIGQRWPGMPHALLCCPMPEPVVDQDPCIRYPHLPQCLGQP